MPSTFTNLLYHLVYSTKNRVPSIHDRIREPLYEYTGGIVRGEGGTLLEIGGVADHVHLLVKLKADMAISGIVKRLKVGSTTWVNEKHSTGPGERFAWQEGYGAFSVSESQVPKLRQYIRSQQTHHERVSFRDELIALLKRHRVDYDERYLLG